MSDTDFSGKTVLVVGGSTGIGNATAQLFRERGANVHVWARRPHRSDYDCEPDSDMTGLDYHQLDVTDFDSVAKWEPPFERLDVLVLCQGQVFYKRNEFELPAFRKVVDTNLVSVMAVVQKFEDMLSAVEGVVVIVSSVVAYKAAIGNPAYTASKAGVVALVRALALGLVTRGVRVNGLAPGLVPTRMTKVTSENERRNSVALSRIPIGRFAEPSEMASVCLFLASPLSSYVIGQTLVSDGGLTL